MKKRPITRARKILRSFYLENKDRGILGIYLWGSVTTADFDPGKSDVDSIAFVRENVPINLEAEAIGAVAKKLPGLSMRFVYLSELKGGPAKGNLTKIVDYRLLGIDFPHWEPIAGTKFIAKRLWRKTITPTEAVQLTLCQIWRRNMKEIKKETGKEKYFVKAMMRLCFYIQQRGQKGVPFSYSCVKATTNDETHTIVNALFIVKQSNYEKRVFMKHLPLFINFLKASKKKYDLGKVK